METPTLNRRYNCVLASWVAQGSSSKPECEECSRDLAGRDVIENVGQIDLAACWVCAECAQANSAEEDDAAEAGHRSPVRELTYVGGGYARDSRGNYREAFWAGTP
jgi:hypothetical protein